MHVIGQLWMAGREGVRGERGRKNGRKRRGEVREKGEGREGKGGGRWRTCGSAITTSWLIIALNFSDLLEVHA